MEKAIDVAPEEARERLNLALKASNEGIWDWWVGQPEIYYSRRILEFLECGEASAPNLFHESGRCVHPDDREAFEAKLRAVLERHGAEIFAADCRLRTGSGDWRWLRMRGAVVRNEEGEAVRMVGSMIDISQRKEAEASLEEERHLLSLFINHVPLHVYFKDKESRFVLVNQSLVEWVGGGTLENVIGKHDRDFYGEAHWKRAAADEKEIMETGEPIVEKVERETWTGRPDTWVMTSKYPWRSRGGELRGTFGVSADVTELVRTQRELAELAAALHERNKEYEEELHLAREIQNALARVEFPEFLAMNGEPRLSFGSRYVPISGMAGDFFEVFAISSDQAGLLICDVMGHGVRSALIVSMLRGLMEKQRSVAADPGAYLSELNKGLAAILNRAEVTMFATAFYAVVDFATSELRYASAGHPAGVIEEGGKARQLPFSAAGKGPGLGLVARSTYETQRLPLEGVHQLLMFTDGILEAENSRGELFLEKRLGAIVEQTAGDPLERALDRIIAKVLDFAEGHQFDDDVCVLAARLGPQ